MGKQDVFKGALGWDDWIWWSGIGGVGLFVLMLLLCCCVCVQRAKRKGREEALATVQARERERQQQEQAQLRYAQAQQARYPSREPSFKYSKPEPPRASQYNALAMQQDETHGYGNAYLMPAAQQNRRPSQAQQQQQQPRRSSLGQALPPSQQQQPEQQNYYSVPKRQPAAPAQFQPQQQEQPHRQQFYAPPQSRPPPQAPLYQSSPSPSPKPSPPIHGHVYQRQLSAHPEQPPLMQYRRNSARPATYAGSDVDTFDHDNGHPVAQAPFMEVLSPNSRNSAAATAIAAAAAAAANAVADANRPAPRSSSGSVITTTSNHSSASRNAGTLRDRIDALREGSVHEKHSRLSANAGQYPAPFQATPPMSHSVMLATGNGFPSRRSMVMSGTVLSDSSSSADDFSAAMQRQQHQESAADAAAFDDEAFDTARSRLVVTTGGVEPLDRHGSDRSVHSGVSGQFDDAESPMHRAEQVRRQQRALNAAPRERTDTANSADSRGSIEF